MKSYHNTTNEQREDLSQSEAKAKTQDEAVLELLKKIPDNSYTPCEIHNMLNLNCPLTSTRRALSNLTKQGLAIRTKKKKLGIYGKLNYCWTLFKQYQQTQIEL